MTCPNCASERLWRHGRNASGKQQYRCRVCDRIFVESPRMAPWVRTIADRMLLQGISIRIASEVLQGYVSKRWLYQRKGWLNEGEGMVEETVNGGK